MEPDRSQNRVHFVHLNPCFAYFHWLVSSDNATQPHFHGLSSNDVLYVGQSHECSKEISIVQIFDQFCEIADLDSSRHSLFADRAYRK